MKSYHINSVLLGGCRRLRRLRPVLIALLLSVSLIFGLVSCGDKNATTTDTTSQPTTFLVPGITESIQNGTSIQSTSATGTSTTADTRQPSRQLKVRVLNAIVYEAAHLTSPVITTIRWLAEVGYISGPDAQGFSLVQTAAGKRGYCLQSQLVEAQATLYARIPEMSVLSVIPNYVGPAKTSHLVDVREFDPSICIDLIFASTRNFTGKQLYARDICLLQLDTVNKLKKAQILFQKDGYSIKIYDAYRPYSVTVTIATYNTNPAYLADPKKGSSHNRGAAIDMAVVNSRGIELEMPSPIHTLDARSKRNNPAMTPAARRNLEYVEKIMVQSGFAPYGYEWWHYTDLNSAKYPYLDINLADVEMFAAPRKPTITPPPVLDPAKYGYVSVLPTPAPTTTAKATTTSTTKATTTSTTKATTTSTTKAT